MITILRWRVACNIWASTLKVKVTAWPFSKIMSGPLLCYLKSDFKTISHNWLPYWDDKTRMIWVATLKAKVTAWPLSKIVSGPADYFFIWSRILTIFHRNDHHIEMTCHAQHLGCYLEGQGHSMTLQQNRVRPITLLFGVSFYTYFWQTTSLCPIPFPGALPCSTGSCLITYIIYFKILMVHGTWSWFWYRLI